MITLGGYSQKFNYKYISEKDKGLFTYRANKYVKFTFKTILNDDNVSEIGEDISKGFNIPNELIGLGKYDFRLKIYITNRFRFILRAVESRIDLKDGTYFIGVQYKF